MEVVSRRELEECVLKKYDPNSAGIIATAPLAAAYVFDQEYERWEKVNCEGILFLYRKTYDPYCNLFLLNRLNNSHLYQPINRQLRLQIENSYLLFKNENGTIIGFWFHDNKYFNKICDEIKKMLFSINLHSGRVSTPNGKDPEISKMLRKVEEDNLRSKYGLKNLRKEKEAEIASSPNDIMKMFENGIDRELAVTESNSVTKFFENASKVFKNTHKHIPVPVFNDNYQSSNIVKNLICNPQYNVESIEKNQRYSFVVEENV